MPPITLHDGFTSLPATPDNAAPKPKNAEPESHPIRTGLELLGAISVYETAYWWKRGFTAWTKKFTSGEVLQQQFKFDSNQPGVNTVNHPLLAGGGYYLDARLNGLGPLGAGLTAAAVSTYFELFYEEGQLATNDEIFTTFGGIANGEALFRGEQYFSNLHLHRDRGADFFGLSSGPWHSLELGAGAAMHSNGGSGLDLSLKGEIVNIPKWGEAGESAGRVHTGEMVKFGADVVLDAKGATDVLFFAESAIAGIQKKRLSDDGHGNLSGYSFALTDKSGYHFRMNNAAGVKLLPEDILGVVNVLEPSADLTFYKDGYIVRVSLDLSGDFAVVHSVAYEKWAETHSTDGVKPVLAREHYNFAFGLSLMPRVSVSKGPVEVSASASEQHFSSIEGQTYNQFEVKQDLHEDDTDRQVQVDASYTFDKNFRLSLGAGKTLRSGTIRGSAIVNGKEDNYAKATLGVTF